MDDIAEFICKERSEVRATWLQASATLSVVGSCATQLRVRG